MEKKTKKGWRINPNNRESIEGFDKYYIDISSLTIYNKRDKVIRYNIDIHGRLNIQLFNNEGKRCRIYMKRLLSLIDLMRKKDHDLEINNLKEDFKNRKQNTVIYPLKI
jgi:hypothetical protein